MINILFTYSPYFIVVEAEACEGLITRPIEERAVPKPERQGLLSTDYMLLLRLPKPGWRLP